MINQKLLFISLHFIGFTAFGQLENNNSKSLKNTVFIEALGNGGIGSLNYERRLFENINLTTRVGVGFYAESNLLLTIPISLQYLIDLKKNSFIETGVGYTWAQFAADDCFKCDGTDNTDNYSNLILSIGYRKHFGNNWMWKASFTPLIANNHGERFQPFIGLSFGKRF